MGIVNVTPDSFSDGGRFADPDAAVAHGLALVAAGADLLDVGGESTRPGAEPVAVDVERARVLPVVERLAARAGVPVSVDTAKAVVARDALAAGATVVNDVSAGRHDPEILGVAAAAGAGYVVMHMQGEPRTMQRAPRYDDVVREVGDFLLERLEVARAAGVDAGALCADPGIGFGKDVGHNLELLARVRELATRVDVPLLVGTSRKTFVGRVLAAAAGEAATLAVDEREEGTLATVVWALDHGAAVVRVHDVGPAATAVRLLTTMAGTAA
jgi:dihydropteroate synthase